MGAPGAGKGTQAKAIAAHYDIPAISTGSIFRSQIEQGTDLGRKVQALISAGDYVPDVVTSAIVAQRLMEPDAEPGWLLDGYPRTQEQVKDLDLIMEELREHLDCVLSLVCDTDQLVERLLKRAQIEGRADDNDETIRHRMAVYRNATEQLIDIYRERGLLIEVDGLGEIDEVEKRIFAALDPVAAGR